ncbi:MAG: hypothetical protein M5U27_03245 [Gaiella sp.]|nr:hypothetical protein [Gaiella sp.]
MSEAFDERDAAAVLAGLFAVNAKLADIGVDLLAIRMLENGDEEEEDTGDEDA